MWQKVKNYYHLIQSFVANLYYGFPGRKLLVIGVTGTSGKTTTTLFIYEMLKAAGYNVSVLSTLKAVIGGKDYDTGFHVTTPDPHVLPKFLNSALKNGDTHFVLEVSSHALDQNRVAFIPFRIGVLTTLAHEHLDYHKTMDNYAIAKFKLLHSSVTAIMQADLLKDNTELKSTVGYKNLQNKKVTFGIGNGDISQKDWRLSLQLSGEYNTLNALAAAAVGYELKIDKDIIKRSLESFIGIPGRFEEIYNNKGLRIIIDFAHKPDAIEAVLQVAKTIVSKDNKVISMFGCASERDTLKRPIMGEISGRLADITVITDEDPRNEDRMKIINEIAEGCVNAGAIEMANGQWQTPIESGQMADSKIKNKHIFIKISDRQEAINFIINRLAKRGDVILLCGKGHEQSMNYKGKELPWSEHEAVKKALQL